MKIYSLSINIIELTFYQDKDNWNYKSIAIEISENESDKVVDLLIYKNHYTPIEKLNEFSGDHNKNFVCRQCLNSLTNENALMIHEEIVVVIIYVLYELQVIVIFIEINIFIRM